MHPQKFRYHLSLAGYFSVAVPVDEEARNKEASVRPACLHAATRDLIARYDTTQGIKVRGQPFIPS